MRKLISFAFVFLFCSGFLGIGWYENYGINKEELGKIEVVPKLLDVFKKNDIRDCMRAAKEISRLKNGASKYLGDLVDIALNSESGRNGNVYIAIINACFNTYDKENMENMENMEKLLYFGISHPNRSTRNESCRVISRANIYSERIIEILDYIAKNDPDIKVKRLMIDTLSSVKYNHEKLGIIEKNVNNFQKSNVKSNSSVEENQYAVALVIGNSDYIASGKSVPNVDYAINDSISIRDYLVNFRGYKVGNIIYLENANQSDLISTLGNKQNHKGKLFNWVRPNESDLFVYYSGHGAPSLTDGSGYLLPVDADPSTVELNGYSIDTLYSNLLKIPAKSITVIIDACFSGSSQGGAITKNASSITLRPINIPKQLGNINILTATDVGQVASWDKEEKHGLFTSYFLKAVRGEADQGKMGNGDKKVSLSEIKNYLDLEVSYMARRIYGREQNPQVSGNNDFIFSDLQ